MEGYSSQPRIALNPNPRESVFLLCQLLSSVPGTPLSLTVPASEKVKQTQRREWTYNFSASLPSQTLIAFPGHQLSVCKITQDMALPLCKRESRGRSVFLCVGGSWCKTPCTILALKCAKPSLQLHKRPPICLFQDQLDLTEVSEVRHNLPGDLPQQPKFHLIKHIKVGLRQSFKVSWTFTGKYECWQVYAICNAKCLGCGEEV